LVFHPRSHFALCMKYRYEFDCTRSKFFIVHNTVFGKEYLTLLVHIAVVIAEKQEIRNMAHSERKYSDIYLYILGREILRKYLKEIEYDILLHLHQINLIPFSDYQSSSC
jgi:hypothetical protein